MSSSSNPAPVEPTPGESAVVVDAVEEYQKTLREKILFGLRVYPAVSPTMLHTFLGTATPKSIWKDVVLEELLREGVVIKEEVSLTSPIERNQTYTILRLRDIPYTPPTQSVHTTQ